MPAINVENSKFETAGQSIDLAALPEKSIRALVSRGLTHYFGSEQASKVKTWKDKFAKDKGHEPAEDEVNAYKASCISEALAKLTSGEIGTRAASGVTIDPLDKLRQKIAKQQVIDILKKNNIKVPRGDEMVKFANGVEKSMGDMIESRLASNGDAIEAEAKKLLAAQAKKVAALPEGNTAEDLGL